MGMWHRGSILLSPTIDVTILSLSESMIFIIKLGNLDVSYIIWRACSFIPNTKDTENPTFFVLGKGTNLNQTKCHAY